MSDSAVENAPVASPQLIRHLNARKVLDHMWTSEPTTASELIEATGLTRATVLALCRALTDQGWLEVLENSRQAGLYTKGRPALRYAFRRDACYVVGVDAGMHRISATVADLCGEQVGYAEYLVESDGAGPEDVTGEERRKLITETVDSALEVAGVDSPQVKTVVIGVPAPVDSSGQSQVGMNDFWAQMNPSLASFGDDRGWDCILENDANLAAVAELHHRSKDVNSSFAVLLSGERMGAGIVIGGQLLRQPRGGAGELGILDLVNGVESTEGLGRLARRLAQEAIAAGASHSTQLLTIEADAIEAEHVLTAASDGDSLGLQIVDELADRLARVCAVLAGLLDLDRIVVSGAVAAGLSAVLRGAQEKLATYLYAPWLEICAASHGADSVRAGAVRLGVERVRQNALGAGH